MGSTWCVKSRHQRRNFRFFGLLFALLASSAVITEQPKADGGPPSWRNNGGASARERWQRGSEGGGDTAQTAERNSSSKEGLDYLLFTGKSHHDAGRWEESYAAFEQASEILVWKADADPNAIAKTARVVATTILNDTFSDYTGRIYEGVMLDYYQALNKLMAGDEAAARVHFNRLKLRQENAQTQLEAYAAEVSKVDTKGKEQQVGAALNEMDGKLQQGISAMPGSLVAAQMRNPAGDVLGALFRKTSSVEEEHNSGEADQLLAKAAAVSVNPEALGLTEQIKTGFAAPERQIFVLLEDGMGPSVTEFRVDLPTFLVSQNILYSGIALPQFVSGRPAAGQVLIGEAEVPTVYLTDINRMASLEFGASYKGKVTKAIVSAAIKTAAQAAINNELSDSDNGLLGLVGKLVVAGTQAALTKADTRHWGNLPNTISLCVVPNDGSGMLNVTVPGGGSFQTPPIPPDTDVLVYIQSRNPGIAPAVFVRALPATSSI